MLTLARGPYAIAMIGGAIAYAITNHAPADSPVLLLVFLVLAAQIYATVLRARDAGVNPVLWSFLIFLPFAWLVLAFKKTAIPTFFPVAEPARV